MPRIPVLALSAAALALPLRAQEPDRRDLPATVITATRLATPLNALTSTVTLLDARDLQSEGLTHVADALRRVPGLVMARQSSFGGPAALFMRGGESDYVRVLVDGIPVNLPGGSLDIGRLTLDDVERIEVLRGPASVLYGSEAVSGVIQIFTRRGNGAARVTAELGAGSYDAQRASLGAGGGSARMGWSLQADRHASDGVLPFNNAYRNDGISGSLSLAPDARTDLRLTTRYNTSMYQYPTNSSGGVDDRNAERTEHRVLAGVELGRRWTDRLDSRVQFTATDLLPRDNDGPDNAADTLGFYGYFARATVKRRLADARSTLRLGAAQFVTLGAEWSRDTEKSASVSLSEFGPFPDAFEAARENTALYAQLQGARERLTYTLGGRLDENTAFGSFRTARIGAGLRLTERLRLRASYGSAFKAPSFFENFATGFTVGNTNLVPEQSRSGDLGLEFGFRNGVGLRITAFQQRFRDLIQYTGAPPAPGDPNYYNIARANAGGVEFEADLPSVAGFATSFSHTWTETRVVDAGFDTGGGANFVEGGSLIRRPTHTTSIAARRALGDRTNLSVTAVRIGERVDRDFSSFPAAPVTLEAVVLLDIATEIRLSLPGVASSRLLLRAENLLDRRYEQVAGFASPGRVFFAGLRLER